MKYYLYQHRRLDTNEIFYVGIGTKNKTRIQGFRTEFERAFAKAKRTDFWKNVINKTNYSIEILLESDNHEFIKNKEIEMINKYGQRYNGSGSLVNFASGGECHGGLKNRNIRITQMDLHGNEIQCWLQLKDIETELGYLKTNITKCCRKKALTAYGYKWKYTINSDFDSIRASTARKKIDNRCVGIKIINKTTGDVSEFRTVKECAFYLNLNQSTILRYFNGVYVSKKYDFIRNTWA